MNVSTLSLITVSMLTANVLSISNATAQQSYAVKLEAIQKIQSEEKKGDELYISVTEFPASGKPSHYQVPNFPTHWLSQYLTKVKDVTLWQKTIEPCQDTKVIFSLVEQDIAPWNIDDLIGSVELTLTCVNGKMTSKWVIPNSAITQKVENQADSFSFTGDKSQYRATFKIEQSVTAPQNKP